MRISIFTLLLCLQGAFAFAGKLPPLTVKDISLMLRSGYGSAEVEREVSARHFIDQIDAGSEKALGQAGATPVFIEKLRSGSYAVPAEEIAAAQNDLAVQAQRRSAQAEQVRLRDSLYQSQLAQQRMKPSITITSTKPNQLASMIRGDLVTSRNGAFQAYDNRSLEKKKYIALYFSAHWCGPCRKFTPQLVDYYNRVSAAHPELEIIFVSWDKTAGAMENYMRQTQMPWPAISFENLTNNDALTRFSGDSIPSLVLFDGDGKIVSDSHDGKKYLGASKVLSDLDRLIGGGGVTQLAQQP